MFVLNQTITRPIHDAQLVPPVVSAHSRRADARHYCCYRQRVGSGIIVLSG